MNYIYAKWWLVVISLIATSLGISYWFSLPATNDTNHPVVLVLPASKQQWAVTEQPSGNFFNIDRTLKHQEETGGKQDKKPVESHDYRFVGVVVQAGEKTAVFLDNQKIVKVKLGEILNGVGTLIHVNHNSAVAIDEQGNEFSWELFPIVTSKKTEENKKS